MSKIDYFFEDTSFRLNNASNITQWVEGCIDSEGSELEHLNYIFCSDQHLHSINLKYLNHDYYTDIITFDNSEVERLIEGDIFISIDRVNDNSNKYSIPFNEELLRVIIHGVLHLIGYNDKTSNEQTMMREKENAYLSLSQF